MSMVRNVMVYLGLAPDDEYADLDYGYPEDYEEYDEPRPVRSSAEPVSAGRDGGREPRRDADDDTTVGDLRPVPRGNGRGPEARPVRAQHEQRSTEPATVTVRRPEPEEKAPVEVKPRRRAPKSFADAKVVADDFRRPVPVVMDVANLDRELSRRLIDFASGLCYGLDGRMEKLSPSAFLLLPEGVEVSAEDRDRLSASVAARK